MNRELKFRTWKNGGFAFFNLLEDNEVDFFEFYRYADDNIEQYIGIKDMHDKEIYEGDIVKVESYSRVFQVVYRKWDCSFVYENDENEEIYSIFNDFPDKYEIVGNIHENPELLGGEE